jgi:dihydroorotate dehydrogenase
MQYIVEGLAKLDAQFRSVISNVVPFPVNSYFYSNARKLFIKLLTSTKINPISIPEHSHIKLWNIDFTCPIFNAAGMFKNGEGYYTCAKMGAGAYLAGTTTYTARTGNKKYGMKHPFIPYPYSKAYSNWMGLPNYGHSHVANKISKIQKFKNCAIGISIAENPVPKNELKTIKEVIEGIKLYEKAGVDFIEVNLSCPNVIHNTCSNSNVIDTATIDKLTYLSRNFLKQRNRNLPLLVKYSNDITDEELFAVIEILIDLGFDGINIGNTSTKYEHYLRSIHTKDISNYKKFTQTFGGGLSGKILKENSLHISKLAVEYINKKNINQEFNVIRTGGIETAEDIINSKNAGIKLNQWFSGFFDMFCRYGFNTYREIIEKI